MEIKMKYSDNGFWVEQLDNGYYRIGLSEKGQDDLGDVAFLEFLTREELSVEESFLSVEASKATTDLVAPLNARVVELHDRLEKEPELLNSTNKEETWIAIVSHVSPEAYHNLNDVSGL